MLVSENGILAYTEDGTHASKMYRVLFVCGKRKVAVLIEMETKKGMPEIWDLERLEQGIQNGTYVDIVNDPWKHLRRPDRDFKPEHIARRDEAWNAIEPIVTMGGIKPYIKKERSVVFAQQQKLVGRSSTTLYTYLRDYWQRGKIKNGLLPRFDNCGGKGKPRTYTSKPGRPSEWEKKSGEQQGIILTSDVVDVIVRGIRKHYLDRIKKMTLKQAYRRILQDSFSQGAYLSEDNVLTRKVLPVDQRPTYNQFINLYYKHFGAKSVVIGREGYNDYLRNHKPLLSDISVDEPYPGSTYEVDATTLDIYLLSTKELTAVSGRPTLYLIIDRYTRMIAGYYLGYKHPSWDTVSLVIANAIMDKAEHCKRYGIDLKAGEWPSVGKPDRIIGDNAEMASYASNNPADGLGITVINAGPYRPDQKPIVERMFRKINDELLRVLPGYVKKDKKRGDIDPRLTARLNIDQLHKLLIAYILKHNNELPISPDLLSSEMERDNVKARPVELWNWGVEQNGELEKEDDEVVRINLFPRARATITKQGIRYKKLFYVSEYANERDWYTLAGGRGKWTEPICFDPNSVNHIYLISEQGEPIPCTLAHKRSNDAYRDMTWYEALKLMKDRSITRQVDEANAVQAKVELDALSDALVAESTTPEREAQLANMTKRERISGISDTRADELDREISGYYNDNAQLVSDDAKQVDEPTNAPPDTEDEPEPDFSTLYLGLIESVQNKNS